MTKKSEQKAFPLWAKIVIGIFGVGLVSTGMLIALNVVTYQAFTTPSVTEQKLENSDLSSNEPLFNERRSSYQRLFSTSKPGY